VAESGIVEPLMERGFFTSWRGTKKPHRAVSSKGGSIKRNSGAVKKEKSVSSTKQKNQMSSGPKKTFKEGKEHRKKGGAQDVLGHLRSETAKEKTFPPRKRKVVEENGCKSGAYQEGGKTVPADENLPKGVCHSRAARKDKGEDSAGSFLSRNGTEGLTRNQQG